MKKIISKVLAVALSLIMTAGTLTMLPAATVGASAEAVEELKLESGVQKDTSKTSVSTRTRKYTNTYSYTKKITLKNSKGKIIKASSSRTAKVSDKTTTRTTTTKYTYYQETLIVKERTVVTDKYTKGSTRKVRTTKIITTETYKAKAYAATEKIKAKTAARVDANVIKAFNDLGYRVKADLKFPGGWYDTQTRLIATSDDYTTIYHELGHFIGFVGGGDGANFTSIYNAEKSKYYEKATKSYASQNQREFFASCYELYVKDNKNMKAKMPKTYAHIQKIIARINDERVAKIKSVYKAVWKD